MPVGTVPGNPDIVRGVSAPSATARVATDTESDPCSRPRSPSPSRPPGSAGWAIGLAVGLLVAAVASPVFAPRNALAATDQAPEHTISVSGTGHVVISPDVADLRLGVSVTKPTVKAARAAAAESMNRVIAALKKLGIADADLQTSGLSLQPVYDYSNNGNPPKLTGYTLSNGVAVTIRDLDKIGDAIDDGLAAGATTLDGVTFRVDDPAKAQAQARQQAMAQAKSMADTLASSAGVSITGVASISESSAPTPNPIYFDAGEGPGARRRQRDAGQRRHERRDRHRLGGLPHPLKPCGGGRRIGCMNADLRRRGLLAVVIFVLLLVPIACNASGYSY